MIAPESCATGSYCNRLFLRYVLLAPQLIDKDPRAIESIAPRGEGKGAKIGACRLVVQSRTIERYLPTNASQASAATVFLA
jgi:hypothetical protein